MQSMIRPARNTRLIIPSLYGCLIVLLMTGCSPLRMMNLINRADNYRSHADVSYGEHTRQTFDVFQPRQQNSGCVVVFVYGGSWEEGRKEQYGFVGAALARMGHTAIIPDYRLYPEVTYPAFVQDVAQSLTHPLVQEYAQSRPLVMMGHSAGAMMAGLVSFNDQYLADAGLDKNIVDGYIALAGPHDYFLPTDKPRWTRIFGEDKDKQRTALTVNHIDSGDPPALIIHGAEDDTVTPKSARSLEQALQNAGVRVTRRSYEDTGHRAVIAAMSRGLSSLAPTLEDIDQFLQTLCPSSRSTH